MPAGPICDCHQVSIARLRAAFEAGERSLPQVAAATRATTGCGQCRPAIRRLLRRWRWARVWGHG